MAKSKYKYYVMVFTNEGPKYVTSINWSDKMAEWDTSEKPLEMNAATAEDIYRGLCLNFHYAVLIKSLIEITSHPYRYNEFEIQFKKKGAKKK